MKNKSKEDEFDMIVNFIIDSMMIIGPILAEII